jgi:hypothetical protein
MKNGNGKSVRAGVVVSAILTVAMTMAISGTKEAHAVDLSGVWTADDGGTYYIRQIGSTVWWFGTNGQGGFANVYTGTIQGDTIGGLWADVPYAVTSSSGELVLKIVDDSTLQKISQTGGFSGSLWQKGPPPTTPAPSGPTPPGGNPWETSVGQNCFEQWITEAMSRLNAYNGDSDFNARKPWSINKYGVLEGNPRFGPTSVSAPDDFAQHNNNKYWWMWDHYPNEISWTDPNWNGAGVPLLRDYVTKCVA